jgi:hypothetical protein
MRWLLVVVLAMAGCVSASRYAVQRPDLECSRATRVVRRTLVELGYSITEMVEASAARPGIVGGTKPAPGGGVERGRVGIRCTPRGVEVQPIEDAMMSNWEFSRKFGYSFRELVQRPDVETPRVEAGLQTLIESMDNYEARLDFGSNATQGGAVLIRITIRNGTDRAVALAAAGLTLSGADGKPGMPLEGAAFDAALVSGPAADRIRTERLERVEVAPNTTAVRFTIYPAGRWTNAQISIEDVETGETEGFMTAVQ